MQSLQKIEARNLKNRVERRQERKNWTTSKGGCCVVRVSRWWKGGKFGDRQSGRVAGYFSASGAGEELPAAGMRIPWGSSWQTIGWARRHPFKDRCGWGEETYRRQRSDQRTVGAGWSIPGKKKTKEEKKKARAAVSSGSGAAAC